MIPVQQVNLNRFLERNSVSVWLKNSVKYEKNKSFLTFCGILEFEHKNMKGTV